ncbi:MAG: hypothetical protein ACE5EY_07725, partial [Anaerolineae bacterium]
SIMERCLRAWKENRLVKLDFPDQMRLRQQVDVVAMRLQEMEEGPLLMLWVSLPVTYDVEDEDDDDLEDWDDDEDMDADDWFEEDDGLSN